MHQPTAAQKAIVEMNFSHPAFANMNANMIEETIADSKASMAMIQLRRGVKSHI